MPFQIHALPHDPFTKYFGYDAAQLAAHGAHLETVTEYPGTPCRVSLADAQVGETVLLVNYDHQPENTPYRASHAIFVRQGMEQATVAANTVPDVLSTRLLSIRGFDETHYMRVADVVDGAVLRAALDAMFEDSEIDYIHVHNAKQGCFAARVTRS
tara:strand:+ start:15378 stop:15845 length:468 start_codon:yes stop_codon:yes gene_type:complete